MVRIYSLLRGQQNKNSSNQEPEFCFSEQKFTENVVFNIHSVFGLQTSCIPQIV